MRGEDRDQPVEINVTCVALAAVSSFRNQMPASVSIQRG